MLESVLEMQKTELEQEIVPELVWKRGAFWRMKKGQDNFLEDFNRLAGKGAALRFS